ncbi:MFS transporter [Rosenbergiella australiborealis]|uniref:MFS transporter n=1 Tax=Rosenbergiella australiborealis TaxID=1544696 RepID=UPI001F4EE722|nr:MFS transporter [Rosenbergiella australiborealis]
MTENQKIHRGIWALAVTAFAIGVAEFIVVGVLPSISRELDISLATAGSLVGYYALALAIGTPIAVLFLSRMPAKPVLIGLIALFIIGNLISATAANYPMLLLGRMITAVAHGTIFAIGATVASRLSAPGKAGKSIAMMFAGLTLAMVVGVPLGSFIGNQFNWRFPFWAVTLLAVLGLIATKILVPSMAKNEAQNLSTQLSALKRKPIIFMMLVTVLGFGASFSVFTYITPILTDITGFSQNTASGLLIVFGIATFVGNFYGGHLSVKIGWHKSLTLLLISLLFIMGLIAVTMSMKIPMLILLFAWGVIAFGISPSLQAGMLDTADAFAPKSVDFSSALNISAFNLGITIGEASGSLFVTHHHMELTAWVSVLIALLAQIPLILLKNHFKNN